MECTVVLMDYYTVLLNINTTPNSDILLCDKDISFQSRKFYHLKFNFTLFVPHFMNLILIVFFKYTKF